MRVFPPAECGADSNWPATDWSWHHAVVTVSAPASSKHTRNLYFDGVLLASGLSAGQLALAGSTTFSIGGLNWGQWKGYGSIAHTEQNAAI